MLVIGRHERQQILIGDHSIVTVSSFTPDGQGVNLGFETRDPVRRVDSAEIALEAARARARILRAYQSRDIQMREPPVWLGFRPAASGAIDMLAALRRERVDHAGYKVEEAGSQTTFVPGDREFLVVRSFDHCEIETIKKLIALRLLDWRLYDEKEEADAAFYGLFARAAKNRGMGGDVIYLDLASI